MKIHILSDLHLTHSSFKYKDVGADVVVVAGDLHVGTQGIKWLKEHIKRIPVLYVLGNHEYYDKVYPDICYDIEKEIFGSNIILLDNNNVMFDDVVFIGSTLWTDFNIFKTRDMSMVFGKRALNDFRLIRYMDHGNLRIFTPSDSVKLHQFSRSYIMRIAEDKSNKKIVVVTHHAPSEKSVSEQYKGNVLNPCFVSDIDEEIYNSNINLWIHGHCHSINDYYINNTRVVCNAKGYGWEDTGWNPELVIEV